MYIINHIIYILGIVFILDILNKHLYKVFPKITICNFFKSRFGLKDVFSLKDYIITKIKIYRGLKSLGYIVEKDISKYDLEALDKLKEFINRHLKQYIKNTMIDTLSYNHMQFNLDYGILDLFLFSGNSIKIRFQSNSNDNPVLEISTINGYSYMYKTKTRYFRFVNPNIKLICEINELINSISLKSKCTILKVA